MALTANRDIDHYVDQELRSFPVKADAHIYKGALVGHVDGFARALVAGDTFLGIAYEEMDNTEDSTTGSDGDVFVRVYTQGDFGFPLPGVGAKNLGCIVYGFADNELRLAAQAYANITRVGHCAGVLEQGQIILRLRTFA